MGSFVFSPVKFCEQLFNVASVTETETYDSMSDFRDQIFRIKENGDNRVPFILVGNKVDLVQKRCVRVEQAENLARQWNCPYFEIIVYVNVANKNQFAMSIHFSRRLL